VVVLGVLMSNDTKKKFDLHSQQGVADLLKQIRASALPSSTKTMVRELVLRYAQRGGDVGVREELESVLATISLMPAPVTAAPGAHTEAQPEPVTPPPVKVGMGGTRPVPTFTASKKAAPQAVETPAPAPAPVAPIPEPVPAPIPAPAPAPEVFTPAIPVEQPVTVPVTPAPAPAPVAPIPEPVPAPAPAPAPVTDVASAVLATTDYSARIQEIKREVIAMIGNPVNLIDIDNTIGKQYMSALLEAMKKANGGTKIEAATAMAALETAYAAVKELIDARVAAAVNQTPTSVPPTTAAPLNPVPVAPEPVVPAIDHHIPAVPPAPSFTPRSVPTEAELKPMPEPKKAEVPPPQVHENLAAAIVIDDAGVAVPTLEPAPVAEATAKPSIPLQDIPNYGYAKAPETPAPAEEPALTKAALPGQYEVSLMTPEITAGLAQLLAEWKIFKSSGLFGMGPSGIEHPLYQRIKQSTMLTITNGTFDGADTDILQSINDYINGWRYERSIIPQHTETFEHFLRRVVKKILEETK
jgi:hypothetical protein